MGKIVIDNEYYIHVDDSSYNLCKKYVNKKGKNSEKIIGYFGSMSSALRKYVEIKALPNDDETIGIKEYFNRIEKFTEQIKKLLP